MPTESSGDCNMLEEKKAALLGRRTSSSTSTPEKGVQSGHGSKNDADDDDQVMVEEDTKKTQAMPPPATSPGRGISSSEKKKHHGMDGAMLEAKKAALAGRTLQPTVTAAAARGAYQIRNDDDAGAVEEQGAINDKTDDGSPPPDAATTANRIAADGGETTDKRKTPPPPASSGRETSDSMLEEKKAALAGRTTQLAVRFTTTAARDGHRIETTAAAAAPDKNTKDDDLDHHCQASKSSGGAEIQFQQQALSSEAKNVTTEGRTSSEDGMSEAKASIMGRSFRLREVSAASEFISSSTQRQTGTENATVGDRSSSELSKNNLAVRSLNLRASRAPLGGDIEVQVQGGHEDSVQEMEIQEEGRVQPGSVAVRGIEGSARSVYFDEDLGDEKPLDSHPHDSMKDQEVLLQAELVRDSVGTSERLRIVEEARQAMASEAVAAEVVEPVHDNKRRVVGCSVIILLLVATVVAISVVLGGKDSSSQSVSPRSADGSKEKGVSPVYTGDQAFATTEELYDAVDEYVLSIASLDSPETSEVALRYGYPIGAWNVSLIANFSRIFDSDRKQPGDSKRLFLSSFNEDVSDWDVSNAETMFRCFAGASSFSGDLSSWSVAKVTDFSDMFQDVRGFNMSSISGWDTSNAEQMAGMFYGAFVTGNLSNWITSKVKNMSQMFYASYFTEYDPLAVFYDDDDLDWCNDVDWGVGAWDVSKVEDMSEMFEECDFAADLSSWDTSKVKNMSGMFAWGNFYGNSLGSLSTTSSVVDMSRMFELSGCYDVDVSGYAISGFDISGFDTSSVVVMEDMFLGTTFASSLAKWNTSEVKYMSGMFASSGFSPESEVNNVTSFGGIAAWDVSKVKNMSGMFYDSSFNADISVWNTTSAVDLSEMFSEAASFSQNLCPWRSELPLEALVESMFNASGCPVPDDPVIPDGPFCFECSI